MSYSEEIILFTINTLNTFEDIGSVTKITSAADSEKELLWREWGGQINRSNFISAPILYLKLASNIPSHAS